MVVMMAVWTVCEGRNTPGHFSFGPSGLISPKSGHYRPGTYVPFSTYLLGLGFGIIIPPQFGKRPFLLSVPAHCKSQAFRHFEGVLGRYLWALATY